MWTRKELKDKAKVSFKANYWKSVLVALILLALAGGTSSFSSAGGGIGNALSGGNDYGTEEVVYPDDFAIDPDNVNVDITDDGISVNVNDNDSNVTVNIDSDQVEELEEIFGDIVDDDGNVVVHHGFSFDNLFAPGAILLGTAFVLLMLVVIAIAILVSVFLFNPLEVGCKRFFLRDLNQRTEVKEVAYAYDNNYKETVKTIFLRDLFIFLWSLLLIIPGIYKAYEYRMIPFLMAEDPTMTKDRAFAESKRLMDGNKWKAFVLDLSFLGWNILSALTLGILGIFYVGPYQAHTNAALYEKLRYGLPAPEPTAQDLYGTPALATPAAQPPIPPFAEEGTDVQA